LLDHQVIFFHDQHLTPQQHLAFGRRFGDPNGYEFVGGMADYPEIIEVRKALFWARLQLLARLTLNPGKHAANQPARLAQLDDGDDRAILVQGDEGPAQVVRLGHRGTPSVRCSDDGAISSPPAP
jgi:hypothetical protein